MKKHHNNTVFSVLASLSGKVRVGISKILWKAKESRFYNIPVSAVFSSDLPQQNSGIPLHIVVITYNNEALLEHQHRLLMKYVSDDYVFVVADNSSDPGKRRLIRAICREKNIAYLSLPANPFNLGSASHGAAINWMYRNYISHYKPDYFGFIDHDVYPVKRHSIIELLTRQPVYGHLQERGGGWYLWAGLCFFNAQLLRGKKFNFMPCKINDDYADTGASNWGPIYSRLERHAIIFPEHHYIALRPGNIPQSDKMEIIGYWLHSFNGSYWMAVEPKENLLVEYLKNL